MPSLLRIVSLEHAEAEGAGKIADWVVARGHSIAAVRLDLGEPFPPLEELDMLVIMGGAPNIYQDRDYPWLKEERAYIASALQAGKIMLGVCLGAQFIADALGACVSQNPVKEIGWFPVSIENEHPLFAGFPAECMAFHWHGDTFASPPGATWIGRSEACENQAFVFGDRVVGLQFHVEVSRETVSGFTVGAESVLKPDRFVQTVAEILNADPDLSATDAGLERLLDGLASVAK